MNSRAAEDELLSKLGRYRAAKRRQVRSACLNCGNPIQGTVRKRFCTKRCANAYAYRTK